MSFNLRKGRRAASCFGLAALFLCLSVLTRAAEAQVIAQAKTLAPSAGAESLKQLPRLAQAAVADEEEPEDLLDAVNVTAQRRRITERENTQTTYVVSRADIQKLGARTLSDALRLVPGFSLAESLGGVDNSGQNFLRGLGDNRFILLQDGRPLTRPSNYRAANLSKLSVVNVERIEVLTGGSTLRYGADAIGGVVNVITRLPEGPPKLTASVQFGSYGSSQYALTYAGSTGPLEVPGNFAYELTYDHGGVANDYSFSYNPSQGIGAVRRSDFYRPSDGYSRSQSLDPTTGLSYTSNTALANAIRAKASYSPLSDAAGSYGFYAFLDSYSGKLVFKPGTDHTVTIYAQQQNARRAVSPTNFYTVRRLPGVSLGDPDPNNYVAFLQDNLQGRSGPGEVTEDETGLNVTWDWNLSEKSLLTTQFSYDHSNEFVPGGGSQVFLNNRVFDAQVRYTSELYSGNNLNAGFQFQDNRTTQSPFIGATATVPVDFNSAGTLLSPSLDKTISRYALFLTDEVQLLDGALILNGGTRFTVDNQFGNAFTSGVGLRYNFGGEKGKEPFGLRANWSQSFKAPGLTDIYTYVDNGPGDVGIPNPATIGGVTIGNGLKAETANGYDIGLDISLSPSALLRATYYRIDIANGLEGRVFAGVVDDNTDTVCPGDYTTCASYNDYGSYSYLYQRRNSSASVSTGWEFSFEWKIDDQWKLDLTHSIFDTRGVGGVNNNDDQGQFFYGYQRAGVPFYTSAFAVSYDTPSFGATLSGSLVGSKPLSNFQPPDLVRPSYFVSDITFRVPVNAAISLNGGLFNIFNTQYEGNSRGVVSPGTNFRVGVSATF